LEISLSRRHVPVSLDFSPRLRRCFAEVPKNRGSLNSGIRPPQGLSLFAHLEEQGHAHRTPRFHTPGHDGKHPRPVMCRVSACVPKRLHESSHFFFFFRAFSVFRRMGGHKRGFSPRQLSYGSTSRVFAHVNLPLSSFSPFGLCLFFFQPLLPNSLLSTAHCHRNSPCDSFTPIFPTPNFPSGLRGFFLPLFADVRLRCQRGRG